MVEVVKAPRRYDSPRRREAAARTRRAVVDAAHELLLTRGFAQTTMQDIATAAGVAVQTVYKVFGTKAGVAKAVFDVAIAGDDEPIPMIQRPSLLRVQAEPDPYKKMDRYGDHLAEVAPRHVPVQLVILAAAAVDDEAKKVWDQLQAERLRGMTAFAASLSEDGHLRRGVSAAEARDVLWTYNSAELFRLVVIERGWTARRYGRWVAAALKHALLP